MDDNNQNNIEGELWTGNEQISIFVAAFANQVPWTDEQITDVGWTIARTPEEAMNVLQVSSLERWPDMVNRLIYIGRVPPEVVEKVYLANRRWDKLPKSSNEKHSKGALNTQ